MMVIVEQTRTRIKVFHVCDAYDIASIKAQRENEASGNTSRASIVPPSVKEEIKEDGQYAENPLLQQSAFLKGAHAIPGSLQVINFVKTKLSYEFSSKYMDAATESKNAPQHGYVDPATARE